MTISIIRSSVTAIMQRLSWQSLLARRKIARLQIIFKIIHQESPLSIPTYFTAMERSTRLYHSRRFILPHSSTYAYQNSF